jgi:hypothetical protein
MIARRRPAPDRYERSLAAIEALLAERGIGRHALFNEVGEGTFFPDGTEAMSGHVVDEQGTVYFFWTAWDEAQNRLTFTTWERELPEPGWSENFEYRQALGVVGRLPPARE